STSRATRALRAGTRRSAAWMRRRRPIDARCAAAVRATRSRRTPRSSAFPLAQLEALDLGGGGLGQLGDELDEARVLVGREPVLDEGLQLVVARLLAGLEHDEGLALGEAVCVLLGDDGAFE